jgi:hypothetical protein
MKPLQAVLVLSSSFLCISAITFDNANSAYSTLQQWYNNSNGLWIPSTGWWNSANCITVIADLALIDNTVKTQAAGVFAETYVKAQIYNLQMQKVTGNDWLIHCYYSDFWPFFPQGWSLPSSLQTDGFLNRYVVATC